MSNSVQVWLSVAPGEPAPTPFSWRTGVAIERYRAAAANFDLEELLRSPATRDGLAVLNRIDLANAQILDVGCGIGHWGRILAQCPAPLCRWRYRGLETSAELAGICRRINPSAVFHVGTAESLPYADRSAYVLDALNALGPRLDQERPLPGDPAFAGRVQASMDRLDMEPLGATLLVALASLSRVCKETQVIIEALTHPESRQDLGNQPLIQQIKALFYEGRGA
ncbi:MAG: class I SAM-dependent methyltransferase [Bacteroidetes bacterium]|nr:class I SAM-dependent methyltransferase [Bacteroidota bacterium]